MARWKAASSSSLRKMWTASSQWRSPSLPLHHHSPTDLGVIPLAGVPELLFHDLRRTALTNMIGAGISEKVAMEITGHRTRKTFERYHIVSDRDIREVAVKMANFLPESPTAGTLLGTLTGAPAPKLLN